MPDALELLKIRRSVKPCEMRGPGRTPSKFVWPTKDIAETMAEKRRGEWEKIGVKYLGAEEES